MANHNSWRLLRWSVRYLLDTAGWRDTPRRVVLRLIIAYRTRVSAGRQVCSVGQVRGPAFSCSAYGRRAVHHYGALLGLTATVLHMWFTPHPRVDDPDCLDAVFGLCDPCGWCDE